MLGKQTSHQKYHMMLYHMFPVFFFLLTTVLLLKVGHSGVMPEKSVNCQLCRGKPKYYSEQVWLVWFYGA